MDGPENSISLHPSPLQTQFGEDINIKRHNFVKKIMTYMIFDFDII